MLLAFTLCENGVQLDYNNCFLYLLGCNILKLFVFLL